MNQKLQVSASPHTRGMMTTGKIMTMVTAALLPACVMGVLAFGMHALLVLVFSTASAVAAEYCYEKLLHKSITVRDGSAVVTGLLIGMNMPPQIDLWIPCLGSVFAIVVIKQLYGGLGKNFMNPALGARCFLLISFSSRMTTFSEGKGLWKLVTQVPATTDALSGATPLAYLKTGACFDLKALLFGNCMGCIGEVSAIALLIGGIFLAGWISAKIQKEKTGRILDALCLSVLPVIAIERIGESRIEDFDISRPLDSAFLSRSFLAVGEEEPCLATYYVAAAVAVVLFVVMAFRWKHTEREGDLTIVFLLLFGAASIITESLRYDRFLSISFVGLQQVAAAIMVALGVILAVVRSNRPKSVLSLLALGSILFMVGAVIFLEFKLDRSTWNKLAIYAGMILVVAAPAGLGLKLLNRGTKRSVYTQE